MRAKPRRPQNSILGPDPLQHPARRRHEGKNQHLLMEVSHSQLSFITRATHGPSLLVVAEAQADHEKMDLNLLGKEKSSEGIGGLLGHCVEQKDIAVVVMMLSKK